MKKIVITQRIDFIEERGEVRDSLDSKLTEFTELCGFLPIPIPNSIQNLGQLLAALNPDGFIISGGNDIGEYLNRDLTERTIITYASIHRLPILGICRGMQMLSLEHGSSLRKINGHTRMNHLISGDINRFVNSFHDYAIDRCPDDFKVIARAIDDYSIEAIRHLFLPWEGWMWHPERENPFLVDDMIRFKNLFL